MPVGAWVVFHVECLWGFFPLGAFPRQKLCKWHAGPAQGRRSLSFHHWHRIPRIALLLWGALVAWQPPAAAANV